MKEKSEKVPNSSFVQFGNGVLYSQPVSGTFTNSVTTTGIWYPGSQTDPFKKKKGRKTKKQKIQEVIDRLDKIQKPENDYYTINWPIATNTWTFGSYVSNVISQTIPWGGTIVYYNSDENKEEKK